MPQDQLRRDAGGAPNVDDLRAAGGGSLVEGVGAVSGWLLFSILLVWMVWKTRCGFLQVKDKKCSCKKNKVWNNTALRREF